jgi:phage gp37-like protein
MYLYPTGRVFGVKTRGGSILVDTSGSMAWDDALLEKLIRGMPGVWVGVYDGHYGPQVQRSVVRGGPEG